MNDITKRYKETTNAIGVTLLVWIILFIILESISIIIEMISSVIADAVAFEITTSLIYGAAYLLSFMLPAIFFYRLLKKGKTERMRLDVKLTGDTFLIISASVACIFAFSYLNGMIMNFFGEGATDSVINETVGYMPNYSLVLQFITIAIVPAFCEEFLFRGVILSNLMPYGKGLAIIGSSVLFGLMHGNFYQFLYTVAAGVLLGVVYVLTDSIWCSILVHLINNSVSILQTAVVERFNESSASVILAFTEGVIFAAGLVSLVILVLRRGKKAKKTSTGLVGVFGKDLGEKDNVVPAGFDRGISVADAVRYFFCPPVTMFVIYSIMNAILILE